MSTDLATHEIEVLEFKNRTWINATDLIALLAKVKGDLIPRAALISGLADLISPKKGEP